MQILVIYEDNYADEFDVHGFNIYSVKEWKQYKSEAKKYNKYLEFYFGTNEECHYDNGKELLDHLTVHEISDEQAELIKTLFKLTPYGFGIFPDNKFGLFDQDDDE